MSAVGASAASAAASGMSSADTWLSSVLMRCISSLSAASPSSPESCLRRSSSPSSSSSSESRLRSSPISSASSRSCTASPNWRWSSSTFSNRSRSRPARSSISGRQRSTSFLAAGGGAMPVRRSRTKSASASSIGASARSVISSNLPRWKRSSSMAERFLATPSMRRAPIASTRACSTASNTARPCWPAGCRRRCTAGSWQAILNAIASAWPRTIAASPLLSLRGGSGSRTFPLIRPGRSAANDTSRSGLRAIARRQPVTARLNGSVGESFDDGLLLMLEAINFSPSPRGERSNLRQRHVDRALRQLDAEAALIELGHDRPLQLVALVQEGEPERETDIVEYFGILRPGDHRARAHYRRDVAVHEGVARQVGDAHHLVDDVAALLVAIVLGLGQHDLDLVVVRQIIQRGDDRPAVHLALVDLLGAVIEARGVAEADRVGGGEQAEIGMRLDHLALVEQRQAAGGFQHALDHEHHVRPAGVVFVEAERHIVLQRPWQDAFAELGDLLVILDDDGILADQIDAADMAVEIDAHQGPVESRRHLLDMGGLAGAVIAGDDDAAVPGEAGENRERGRRVEPVIGVDVGHVLIGLGIGRHFHVAIDAELLPDRHLHVGQPGDFFSCSSQFILS